METIQIVIMMEYVEFQRMIQRMAENDLETIIIKILRLRLRMTDKHLRMTKLDTIQPMIFNTIH